MTDPILHSVKTSIKALRRAIATHPTDKAKRLLALSLKLEQELTKENPSIAVLDEITQKINENK